MFLGCKGDWPWLRSAYRLYTGYTSKRKCHLCEGAEPLLKSHSFHNPWDHDDRIGTLWVGEFEFQHESISFRLIHICTPCINPGELIYHGDLKSIQIVNQQPYGLCNRVPSLAEDWWDLSRQGSVRTLPSNLIPPDPFYGGPKAALRNIAPHGDSPLMLKIDLAHTYAIAGFGKDEMASTLIFLAVRCCRWGSGNYPSQLDAAYASFWQWCIDNKKTSTIKGFNKEELKIKSPLNLKH